MSDTKDATYTAVITISLPDGKGKAAAHLTLAPPDMVGQGAAVKPLKECTLAELQLFADQLESEIWEVYKSIKLIDLSGNQAVTVAVERQGQEDAPAAVADWLQQAVVLPSLEAPSQQPAEAGAGVETAAAAEQPAADLTTEEQTATEPPQPPLSYEQPLPEPAAEPAVSGGEDAAGPEVTVSETESVVVEREAGDDPGAFPTPAVAPSQARVRIAGRRLAQGHPTWAAADILIDEPALRAAQAHALSSMNREVAGVLLGPPPEKQPDGRYVVHVFDTVVAKHTVMQGASVTYTPESWRYMNDKLFERYPDGTAVMVGWYHTHPGFGIFLSGMDQFIHQNFFTQIWHTALVLDPVARKSGFFCWDRAQSRVGRYEFGWPSWAAGSW